MAVWLEDHADAPVVAITGTKGKSTTAALAAAILEADGLEVALIGNIGVPVLDTYARPRPDAFVVEVSSYQAADVTRSPGVVVLTSLAPDHLDWHGGVEAYYRDKLRLVEAGPDRLLAVSAGNPEAVRRTADHPHRTLYGPVGRVHVDPQGWVEVDGTRLAETGPLRLPGRHNVWNLWGGRRGPLAPGNGSVGRHGDRGRGRVRGPAQPVPDDRCPRRPDLRGRRPRLQSLRLGGVHRDVRRAAAHGDRGRRGPGGGPWPLIAALAGHRPTARTVVLPPARNGPRDCCAARCGPTPFMRPAISRRRWPWPRNSHRPVGWCCSRRGRRHRTVAGGTGSGAGDSPAPPDSDGPDPEDPEAPTDPGTH